MTATDRCQTCRQQVRTLSLEVGEEGATETVDIAALFRPKQEWHRIQAGNRWWRQAEEEQNLLVHNPPLVEPQQLRSPDELLTSRCVRSFMKLQMN